MHIIQHTVTHRLIWTDELTLRTYVMNLIFNIEVMGKIKYLLLPDNCVCLTMVLIATSQYDATGYIFKSGVSGWGDAENWAFSVFSTPLDVLFLCPSRMMPY